MSKYTVKTKMPRGKMPPGTSVHKDRKKEASKSWCRKKRYVRKVRKVQEVKVV